MESSHNIYLTKAQEAIECVYESEYHNSLGIPLPMVELLLADDPHYSTGEYYITINNTWQIHLKFGQLPISYKEFQDEVKVLTRHEVGHYMCCPYDAITQFRMLKCILNIYENEFKQIKLDQIDHLCRDLANQFADIIVDTRNFLLNPEETLKSEINWIKKCGGLMSSPPSSKLMFLTKEILWGHSLEINEQDESLLSQINDLAIKLSEGGFENKSLFLPKLESYTRLFFNLLHNDLKENRFNQQGDSQNGQQQGNSKPTPKDGDKSGNAIVFSDPDKVKDAIEQLASETSVEEFIRLLQMAGIEQLSDKKKEMLWFSVQSSDMIVIDEESNKGSRDNYTYPTTWKIGDSISEIDMMLSLSTAPKIIPGITTKKWEMSTNNYLGAEKNQRDLLLVVDTSGSMKNVLDESSNMHQAVLAVYGIISYFEQIQGKIALIEFNERVGLNINWTHDYDDVRNNLLVNGQGGTSFPISAIRNMIDKSKNEIVTIIITDGELGNLQESLSFFREYIEDDNKLYIFIIGQSKTLPNYERLKDIGAKVFQSNKAEDFCQMVTSDMN